MRNNYDRIATCPSRLLECLLTASGVDDPVVTPRAVHGVVTSIHVEIGRCAVVEGIENVVAVAAVEHIATCGSPDDGVAHDGGSDFADIIVGSDNDEDFIGRQGDDTIDGGGVDTLKFDRSCCATIEFLGVLLDRGLATGKWNGQQFLYRISNIEDARGSDLDDGLRGNSAENRLRGNGGDDNIDSGGGDDRLAGSEGEDRFYFEAGHGNDRIDDFTDGEDRMRFSYLVAHMTCEIVSPPGGLVTCRGPVLHRARRTPLQWRRARVNLAPFAFHRRGTAMVPSHPTSRDAPARRTGGPGDEPTRPNPGHG